MAVDLVELDKYLGSESALPPPGSNGMSLGMRKLFQGLIIVKKRRGFWVYLGALIR